jgi:SAM-dependent MidA family methyltransferase
MQHLPQATLPEPDSISAAHSLLVARHVSEKIAAAGGCISFAAFMHEALYAPGLGYYSAGAAKFGPDGDFTTAPEVSSLFGHVLARQCAAVLLEVRGNHGQASILEFGAGSGKLAADVLARLSELHALPDSYQILEVSADLRERQESYIMSAIPELASRVTWLNHLPDEHRGVILANEVLDAMPVERFVRRTDHVAQMCVAVEDDRFAIVERAAPAPLAAAVAAIENDLGQALPEAYVSEANLAAAAWVADIAATLRAGMAFLFDYGVSRQEYYAADRSDGWLRCHFRHHAHADALILPGIQDITSWVDFSSVASAAIDNGLNIAGYVSQAHFLINGGLADELADFTELAPAAQLQLSAQVKLLTLPGEMGENFKCLGISRALDNSPPSFAAADRAFSL